MKNGIRAIAVGWEHEVPIDEVQVARDNRRAELEAFFHMPVDKLTDADVARFIVRSAHPTARYLRPDVMNQLGFQVRSA